MSPVAFLLCVAMTLVVSSAQEYMRLVVTQWIVSIPGSIQSPKKVMECPARDPDSVVYTYSTPYTGNASQCYPATQIFGPRHTPIDSTTIQGACTASGRWFTAYFNYLTMDQTNPANKAPCVDKNKMFEVLKSENFNVSQNLCHVSHIGSCCSDLRFFRIQCMNFDPSRDVDAMFPQYINDIAKSSHAHSLFSSASFFVLTLLSIVAVFMLV